MKTWEMMKILSQNESKEFINQYDDIVCAGYGDTDEKGSSLGLFYKSDMSQRYEISFDDEWTEVKGSVDFMTAVESRKRVKLIYEPFGEQEYRSLSSLFLRIAQECRSDIARDIILNGKFYIED